MILKPQNLEELLAQLAGNFPVGERFTMVELGMLDALVVHSPDDMTASVEAGMPLASLQNLLRARGQWLPIDPPGFQVTVGDLLAENLWGSRRLGYGTIRDYLIGIKVAMADGTLIKSGGKVVKNVAGYDLCKLFIGARHSLGIIVEATFKLRPLPEKEVFCEAKVGTLEAVDELCRNLRSTRVEPVLLDAHNLDGEITMIAAFAGNHEDVDAQVNIARRMGFNAGRDTSYPARFWSEQQTQKLSVLPSKCVEEIQAIKAEQWIAHLGIGIIYFRGGIQYKNSKPDAHYRFEPLLREAYDPKGIFGNFHTA